MKRLAFRMWTCATFAACVALGLTAEPARAAVAAGPLMAPVHAFATALNNGAPYPDASFTSDCTVLDDFPPYAWRGPSAPRRWYAGLMGATPAERRMMAAMHARIAFASAQYARIEAGRAYLVVPGTLTLIVRGKLQTQHGRWTLSEVRAPGGWRIASQAWAIEDGFADD